MHYIRIWLSLVGVGLGLSFCTSCSESRKKKELFSGISTLAENLTEARTSEDLKKILEQARETGGSLNDSVRLNYLSMADSFYQAREYKPLWSHEQQWLPVGDSIFQYIQDAKNQGLFPADYHFRSLAFIHRVFTADSLAKKNSVLWARADILMTDAFFLLVRDLKQGRIKYDSVTLRTDSSLKDMVFYHALESLMQNGKLGRTLSDLEPSYKEYDSLKYCLRSFLAKADFSPFTYLPYPYKDSVIFFHILEKRLQELGFIPGAAAELDTNAFKSVLRRYQRSQGLKVTGHLSDQLVDRLNNTDWEKFKRIAVNLDRYKLLPESLPHAYVWVNLPAYVMKVFDGDTLVFSSRVIVGEPDTRTPLLNGEISNFVTFPQWTVPYSIIFREILPKIQEDSEYLNKQNLIVVDENDSVYDPHTIRWDKLSRKHFPYILKQREGDDNSLGIIKFNFKNKYSVYLHDTNVRWRFAQAFRALSHGCVRVKEWKKLASFLLRDDSTRHQSDSLKAWIRRQEKHTLSGFPRVPIFIRYFTCEGSDGRIKFYEDIYEEDRLLTEKYFYAKTPE
jgi:murein L,D-transpeptidase YcbB/YkuD